MDRKPAYPRNPLSYGMSYENRLKRYHREKDKLLRDNIGVSAADLQEKHDRLMAWWGV